MYLIDIVSDACVNFAKKYKHKQLVLMLKLITSNWLLFNAQVLGCDSAGHYLDTVDQHLLFSYFLNNTSYCWFYLFTNGDSFNLNSYRWMLLFFFRHPTSCCSIAEVMSVLFFNTMKYTISEPRGANNDRFVLSKVTTSRPCHYGNSSLIASCFMSLFVFLFWTNYGICQFYKMVVCKLCCWWKVISTLM